ncbi:MAG: malonate decarboxylase subunit alpha [Chloroflexi bacterium]|nr:malonate decarboxylase subunit alpha [Chloroflexota bacterium]
MNKLTSMEAAAAQVESGHMLALGGVTLYRRPMAFTRALLRRHAQSAAPTGLTLLAFTAGLESDLLVGAGLIARTRACYFGLEIFGLAPMFTHCANHGAIEIIEESEASLALGLRAQMAGVGFMPGRAWLGTDLPRLRPDVRTVSDPYSSETLMAFPAIRPDVAVIHALRADPHGNAQIGQNRGVDEELALTAGVVIVTAEEIVPQLTQADLAAPFIHHVVHAPGGAKPTSCHPLYPLDGRALMDYTARVSDPEGFRAFIQDWIEEGIRDE